MPNRLAESNSPYLLQHADNPVDWRPWGPEPLAEARHQEKPIFLSIGYSACHWCHVMAHESFEDPEIARRLNQDFIPIKVDREEHPELDQVYMDAVQALVGQGGWPLSVFLTPDLEPFFGGTYWPPRPRGGMPGFAQVLAAVADAWQHRREQALQQAKALTGWLRVASSRQSGHHPKDGRTGTKLPPPDSHHPSRATIEGALAALGRAFDPVYGGFGSAPKFPQPLVLRLLLQSWRRSGDERLLAMVTTTLDKMAAGGIYDHLGGGFHRYSTDAQWLVPHFEKMLYDNALLARCYLDAYQAVGGEGRAARGEETLSHPSSVAPHSYHRIVRETLDYILRDMTDPAGGFYSSEDADSEGHEGLFYLWTPEDLQAVLGPQQARSFAYVYDVTEPGNFEGRNILNLAKPLDQCAKILGRPLDELAAELAESRQKLLEARSNRVRPGRDDKVLVSWNGLMIDALAAAGTALGEPRYTAAAVRAAEFLLKKLPVASCQLSDPTTDNRQPTTDNSSRRLRHSWRRGRAEIDGLLEDYASLAGALVTLYETQHEERWLDEATNLADEILDRFADREHGGFFTAPRDQEWLIVRKKDFLDSAIPSGGGLATMTLLRLARLRDRPDYTAAAEATLGAAAVLMRDYPLATGQMFLALDSYLWPAPPGCDDFTCPPVSPGGHAGGTTPRGRGG